MTAAAVAQITVSCYAASATSRMNCRIDLLSYVIRRVGWRRLSGERRMGRLDAFGITSADEETNLYLYRQYEETLNLVGEIRRPYWQYVVEPRIST